MEPSILKLLGRKSYVPANVPELLEALKLPKNKQQQLQAALKGLVHSGQIARIKGNRYILPQEADLIPGRIQITRHGRGFLTPDEQGIEEISIPAEATSTALHNDHVLVRREVQTRGKRGGADEKPKGRVVEILERSRSQIVGTLKKGPKFLYVIPDDPRMPHDIYVEPPRDVGRKARSGDKVVVELKRWESRKLNPEGVVTEVLGPPTAEGVDMLGVLRQYDLPLKFPKKILQEVKRFGSEVTDKDMAGRTDCRKHQVITIDPADARDFDDAFYLKRTDSGQWKLWVHIADVSHYVKPGSALDTEAKKRGNSTYLVDRVIPMLPEALSNELCSLKPKVDRLTKCVEFTIADDGAVVRSRFYPAVIHSKRRYSYEEAMEVLDRKKPADEIEKMLVSAGQIALRIRKRRFKAGALEMEFPETKIRLDDRGRVKAIEKSESDLSHQLIEEFMLLANEAVAGRLMKLKTPTIYRIHEKPDPRRLQDYREQVLSHNVTCGNLEKPAEVQRLLKRLNGIAIGGALKIGFLRSMMRARYCVDPLGHYGLAKQKYAHFTSPIRRYADLVVHRSLFEKRKPSRDGLAKVSDHISSTERNSSDAERDSKSVKLYAFLEAQLKSGKLHSYSAMVIEIRNFGFFVDVTDLGMSGLVPLSALADDFYEFDAVRLQVRGRRTKRVISTGDIVQVQVAKVDSFKKQVDFRLTPTAGGGKGKAKRSARKRSGKKGDGEKKNDSRGSSSRGRRGGRGKKEQAKKAEGAPTKKKRSSSRRRRRRSSKKSD